jgi:hypothetical protein
MLVVSQSAVDAAALGGFADQFRSRLQTSRDAFVDGNRAFTRLNDARRHGPPFH